MHRKKWWLFYLRLTLGLQALSATQARALCILVLALVMRVGWTDTPAQAQKLPTDFTELSLQELMNIDVLSIDILGTHTHLARQWMLRYRFMFMSMDGNRDGTDRISVSEILREFPSSPTKMTMEMHMIEGMYAPTNDLTLMAMLPYKRLAMDQVTRGGVRFTEKSDGLGDLTLKALYTVLGDVRKGGHRLIFNAGLSLPTGSIDKRDFMDDPTLGKLKLEYPMQLGSGTVDLLPGVTYLGQAQDWAWMAEGIGTIRLGQNSEDYRLGNRVHLTVWVTRKVTSWFAPSVRLDGQIWENVHGADPELDPTSNPSADPKRQKGRRLDLLLGLNLYAPGGKLKGLRLAIEGGFPIYQSLGGPQLETDWLLTVGLSQTF